jgi:hypothetical protein
MARSATPKKSGAAPRPVRIDQRRSAAIFGRNLCQAVVGKLAWPAEGRRG